MSESLPITTPPRRHHPDHHGLPYVYNNSSESCKNTPNSTRKLEPYHHALLESGSQSAKSSPLPHRRLDKLEGTIRDKPSPLTLRRRLDSDDQNNSSSESSPAVVRKFPNQPPSSSSLASCSCNQQLRRNTDTMTTNMDTINQSSMMRRRVESDCNNCSTHKSNQGCSKYNKCDLQKSVTNNSCECGGGAAGAAYSPQMYRKQNVYSSPAKSVIGEPGCFSSPIHRGCSVAATAVTVDNIGNSSSGNFSKFSSPAKSVIGEPGVFASPARSLCMSPCDENLEAEIQMQPDQTVVSGWLKFRDNKRVSFDIAILFLFFFFFVFLCFVCHWYNGQNIVFSNQEWANRILDKSREKYL